MLIAYNSVWIDETNEVSSKVWVVEKHSREYYR